MQQYIFDARIVYEWAGRRKIFNAKVLPATSGPEDGKISLIPKNEQDVSGENLHLDFKPTYQTYNYNEDDKALIISGQSPQMGGKYCVSIHLT